MNNNSQQVYHKSSQRKAKITHWDGLFGSDAGLAISRILSQRPLLVIAPDELTAASLEREVRFFLKGSGSDLPILNFPGWETLPYDHFSPHEDVISQRLSVLYQLASFKRGVVFVSASTVMHRLPPKKYVEANSFILSVGEDLDLDDLRKSLEQRGYNFVTKVMEHGEFSVRGSIIDVFPMGSKSPFRIDLFDTAVDSIRVFDPDTQRSINNIDAIRLLPAKEFPLDEEGVDKFCASWRLSFAGNPINCPVYQAVSDNKSYPGIEYYLPFFFDETATLFEYLPKDSLVVTLSDTKNSFEEFWQEVESRYEQLSHDKLRPILLPKNVFSSPQQLDSLIDGFDQLLITGNAKAETKNDEISYCFKSKEVGACFLGNSEKNRILALKSLLDLSPDSRLLLVAESAGRKEALLTLLKDIQIFPAEVKSWHEFMNAQHKAAITVAQIERPLHIEEDGGQKIIIVTETQIFGERVISERKRKVTSQKVEAIITNLTELQVGDPVVHIDYGIGRYTGLQKLQTDDYETEFLVLEYANTAKLYVPVTALGLISRYTGVDADRAPLNQLGTKQWEKTKQTAKEQTRDTAAELLEIYARRMKAQGFAFVKPDLEYERFNTTFPFVVTPDQDRAINEVISDMISKRPMDRLICGDVGFGKTEVAMRAAFLAVYNGKQVAILTPTTLLAQQHFVNFQDRFASWPIKTAILSRFGSTKQVKGIIEDLAEGKIDVVIGTHKLLQKNVQFKNLGLLVVDEEHRFGVRQKEHIKELAANVDILSLTATPIPRTLNMAFAEIRDFSIISTPPAKRLAIKTFISEHNPYLVKEAITRETLRGGQVYFLHNNITSIEKTARELKELVPSIRVAVAHGQMRKQELEAIMHDFYHQHINVLVCTTIIESGLDVPSANTIIINRADRFGLAQLHQLRGRVGRSHHQAYAYLIVPPRSILTSDAKKRLDAVEAMKDLGTGFALATNDLEIRGTGELLGEKQSGVIQGVGFSLYMSMLKRAVRTLKKGEKIGSEDISPVKPEIELQISTLIPDEYIDSVNLRLVLYKRIAEAKNQKELDDLQVEMIDRFGLLPKQTKNLFRLTELELLAQELKIIKITLGINKGSIQFGAECSFDLRGIIGLMQKHAKSFKFIGSTGIEFQYNLKERTKFEYIDALLIDIKDLVLGKQEGSENEKTD